MADPNPTSAQSQALGSMPRKEELGAVGNLAQVSEEINNVNTRLKVVEERYDNVRRKIQVIEQDMLNEQKRVSKEFKLFTSDITETRRTIEDLKDSMRIMVKELKMCAKLEDVETLKKYIEIWEPMDFVTKNELKKVVEGLVEDKMMQLSPKKAQNIMIEERED